MLLHEYIVTRDKQSHKDQSFSTLRFQLFILYLTKSILYPGFIFKTTGTVTQVLDNFSQMKRYLNLNGPHPFKWNLEL